VALTPEFRNIVFAAARQAGDELDGKLPPSHRHPGGRSSHAHVFERIRTTMGRSYKDCNDWEVSQILRIIESCLRELD